MVLDNITLQTAKKRVANFGEESDWMSAHREAMDCRECEAFLQLGIEAFQWIIRADQVVRELMANHDVGEQLELEEGLCRVWIKPCDFADEWIGIQATRGYHVDMFRRCCTEMKAIVESLDRTDEPVLPEALAKLQDQSLIEHSNGQTSEFF